ncbi:MAG: GNAT family N-acetyltransferase [Vulcanimicrobiaceae bacterium]
MIQSADFAAILKLNAADEIFLAPLDAYALRALLQQAFHIALRDHGRDAFLIALDQSAVYGSPNFRWFKARFPCFAYVDRLVVAPHARGQGIGRNLYGELFDVARAAGHEIVACEVNVDPPNPTSDAFHAALGFEEIGRAAVYETKTVRYLIKRL